MENLKEMKVKDFIESDVQAAVLVDPKIMWGNKLYALKSTPYYEEGIRVTPIYLDSMYNEQIPGKLELTKVFHCKDGSWYFYCAYYKNKDEYITSKADVFRAMESSIKEMYVDVKPTDMSEEWKESVRKEYNNGFGVNTDEKVIETAIRCMNPKVSSAFDKKYIRILTGYLSIQDFLESLDYKQVVQKLYNENEFKKTLEGSEDAETKIKLLFRQKANEGCVSLNVAYRFGEEVVKKQVLTNFEAYHWLNGPKKETDEFEKAYTRFEMEKEGFEGFIPYIESVSRGKKVLFTQEPKELSDFEENAFVKTVERYNRYWIKNEKEFLQCLSKCDVTKRGLIRGWHRSIAEYAVDVVLDSCNNKDKVLEVNKILTEKGYDFSLLGEHTLEKWEKTLS